MLLFAVAVLPTLKYTVGWLIVSLGFIVSVTISPDLAYEVLRELLDIILLDTIVGATSSTSIKSVPIRVDLFPALS